MTLLNRASRFLAFVTLCSAGAVPMAVAAEFDWGGCEAVHHFSADAFVLEGDELLYRESHRQCHRDGRLVYGEMRYLRPAGGLFAEKWLDYTPGAATPDFQLTDHRSGYSEGARRRDGRVELNRRMRADAPVERERFRVPDNAVIDSGFDEFVRARFAQLLQGETVRLKFLVAGELDSFSFKAHGLQRVRWGERDAYHVRVEHDSFLVRMLLEPILLWYDATSLQLLEYRGISNIKSDAGARHDARIVYPPDSRRVEKPAVNAVAD